MIGVLSALAVGNWATVQDERNMLGTHTARVRASLGLDGQRLRRWSDIGEVKETGLVALLAELDGEGAAMSPSSELIALFFAADENAPILDRAGAYDEMILSGVSRHLDQAVLGALGAYYVWTAENQERANYLDWSPGLLAGVVPARMRGAIRDRGNELDWPGVSIPFQALADSLLATATAAELGRLTAWRSRDGMAMFLETRLDATIVFNLQLRELRPFLLDAGTALGMPPTFLGLLTPPA